MYIDHNNNHHHNNNHNINNKAPAARRCFSPCPPFIREGGIRAGGSDKTTYVKSPKSNV